MSPPNPSAETPWYSWRPNTCSLQETCSLPDPPLRLLSHWQGWKEDAPSAKGTPGWSPGLQGPLFLLPGCAQLHGASMHPGLGCERPLSPPAATGQFKSVLLLYGKNFLIPCGASWHLHTALQPGCHRSPSLSSPPQQNSETCVQATCATYPHRQVPKHSCNPAWFALLKEEMVHNP